MSFISDFFIGLLTSYIAVTATLAGYVEDLFIPEQESKPPATVTTDPKPTAESSFLNELPSRLSAVPDILLRSAEYQQAALGDAIDLSQPTTTDPLDAIVNIFCTFQGPDSIRTTTGTGFFIDSDGVIITNAHVAQFLLVAATDEFGDAECTVRTGDPAVAMYTASLLYIPPAWVQENAAVLRDNAPMGTGERDYALLFVDGTLSGEPLPAAFPALPYKTDLLSVRTRGDSVIAAGYPAGALLTGGSASELIPQKAETSISELYTFGSNTADVFSIRGSVVGAEGASGGPVLDSEGAVIGMIVTRGDDSVDGAGSLRAITFSHIESTITQETGFALSGHLNGNIALRSQLFSETLTPFLLALLDIET